jgi:hypothetical protein
MDLLPPLAREIHLPLRGACDERRERTERDGSTERRAAECDADPPARGLALQ